VTDQEELADDHTALDCGNRAVQERRWNHKIFLPTTTKMYFIKYIDKELSLHPSRFNEDVFKMLKKSLYDEEEGTCNGEYFTICIMDFHSISAGKVRLGSGMGEYKITYRAIIWKPFKGETVGQNCTVLTMKHFN
jgi:DNA-directed RNA polymerase subunit E'/Rpb7